MNDLLMGAVTALWLGLLTSISPCPLATNIAAISYIGQGAGNRRRVFLTGVLYALGRTLAYVALAAVMLTAALSVPQVSLFLQKNMHYVLGPVLILVGMVLLELIDLRTSGSGFSQAMQHRVEALGIWGALLLGVLFAMSFCPTSAALYFGTLIPLSLKSHSAIVLPLVYGIGTALPVLVFATLLAWSASIVGKTFNVLTQVEWWARHLTGGLFVVVGIYFTLKYVFELF